MSRPTATWAGVTRTIRVPDAAVTSGVECLVVLNRDETGALREVFVEGRPGRRAEVNGLCRVISLALQSGISPGALARTLRGLRDDAAPVWWGPGPGAAVLSLPDALARLLDPDAEKGDEP